MPSGNYSQNLYPVSDIDIATVTSAGTAILTWGNGYYGTVGASTLTIAFAGSVVNGGAPITASINFTSACTVTIPSSIVSGNATNPTTTRIYPIGYFTIIVRETGGTVEWSDDLATAGGNKVTNVAEPTASTDAATKNYVDTSLAGFQPLEAVYAASTTTIAGTYVNGGFGVGATFTVTATGALSMDGVNPPLNSRVLLKDQSPSGFQNGVYNVTIVGTTGISPVLTRSLDYNTPADMNAGDLIPVINGTVNTKTSWLQTATITTIGSDALVFVKYSSDPSNLTAINLSISGQTGLLSFTGLTSTNRIKTIRDAADTVLELGGSYTPTGTWTSLTMVTPALGTPASGNLANCGHAGYAIEGGVFAAIAPADAQTYYFGYNEGGTIGSHTTIANSQMTVPKAGTITRVLWQVFINTNGSNEAVQHYLRLNNTTDTTLSTSETYDPGATTTKVFTYTGLSIAVVAGDTIAFKVICPTWATNPTITTAHLRVWVD